MAYTRPDGAAADFDFTGVAYTRPDGAAADFSFLAVPTGVGDADIEAIAAAGVASHGVTANGSPEVGALAAEGVGEHENSLIEAQGDVSLPTVEAAGAGQHRIGALAAIALAEAVGVGSGVHGVGGLGAATISPPTAISTGAHGIAGRLAITGPLGTLRLAALNDFTGQLGDAVTLFVMDLVTPGGVVRVPISSWQATLQTAVKNYVQAVIPACSDYVDSINAATEFAIYRRAELPTGEAIEYEMARAPLGTAQYSRGPQRYTCVISGYSDGFAEDEDPSELNDRTLTGIRSTASGTGLRVRCSVDWLLRPGQRAYADGVPFVVDYINYYCTDFDAYMDAGERV